MIRVENIQKYYGSLHVLKGVNVEIKKGEVVSIVGPSVFQPPSPELITELD